MTLTQLMTLDVSQMAINELVNSYLPGRKNLRLKNQSLFRSVYR